jgi:hypothetical protein
MSTRALVCVVVNLRLISTTRKHHTIFKSCFDVCNATRSTPLFIFVGSLELAGKNRFLEGLFGCLAMETVVPIVISAALRSEAHECFCLAGFNSRYNLHCPCVPVLHDLTCGLDLWPF